MTFKKIELNDLHPANPLVAVIDSINENFDILHDSLENLAGSSGIGSQGVHGEQGIQGEQGPAGQDGKDGKDGTNGADGLPGVDGKDGIDGLPGRDGAQGPQGIAGTAGKDGLPGATGSQGIPGKDGAQGVAGVGIKGIATGYVDAGTFITLDNIKCSVTTTGNRGLSLATTTGAISAHISATFGFVNGVGGNATTQAYTYNTSPSGSLFGYSFPNQGDGSVYLINDVTNWRFYRVTLMIGPGYSKNFISIERLA